MENTASGIQTSNEIDDIEGNGLEIISNTDLNSEVFNNYGDCYYQICKITNEVLLK